jgi:UDP-GlcNAc:undecaprenyl-phosphate/decaprenyl-phosphate GlcNAc-1-phosphate transferase
MIPISVVLVAFAVAYLASALTVPALVRLANTKKLFDFPDRDRRGHPSPVPRLGGVAVFTGLVAALIMAKLIDTFLNQHAPELTPLTFALGAGSAILFILGLYDDVRGVPPIAKLAAQAVAALLVIYAGFRIDVVSFPPNFQFSLGLWSIPVTVLWLVGVSNALNLVDGMDGLAGGVTIIALCVTTGAAIVLGNGDVAWQTFALIGALVGFLRYNAPPARIFLGDSGSLVTGFLLAVLSVKGATRHDGALFALAPIFALSYPLLDTGISILRRFLRSEPLSRADGRHIHHQLRAIGLPPRRAVAIVLLESAVVGLLGLSVTFAPPELTVAVASAGGAILVFVFAYGMRWLQYHEFVEAGMSVTSVVRNARVVIRDKIMARDVALLIDQAGDLEDLSAILQKSADLFRFTRIELCFDSEPIPSLRSLSTPTQSGWRVEYPIGPLPDAIGKPAGARSYLVITCPVLENGRQAGPERVARILAPAIARWLSGVRAEDQRLRHLHARPVTPRSMRDSGEHYKISARN